MQPYLNWEMFQVSFDHSNPSLGSTVHVFYRPNINHQYTSSLQAPPEDIPWYFVIGLFKVNEHHMQVSLPFSIFFYHSSYKMNGFSSRSSRHESKLILRDGHPSSHPHLHHSLPDLHTFFASTLPWTSPFHHQSPLWPPKLPLDTPKTFEATSLMQLAALFHMASASPLPLQSPILINFSPISRERAGVKPPHLILGRSDAIFFLLALLISRSITKSLCWVIWLVSGDKRFAGDYLAFAGVGCSPELLFVVLVLAGAKENRERGSPFAGPREVSGRRSFRLPDQRLRPVAGWFSRMLADRRWLVLRLSN
ncbi:hypothetical protein H5410_051939 [Solanum commersonii]|uniref:Uncharacterized protein n=1 Tax=Solanum commersonii TaxID=4109 RepID=A0A9J5X2J8_SOLCO|nr:hypothetical protein H5410_051939 [Solanum commersonii]